MYKLIIIVGLFIVLFNQNIVMTQTCQNQDLCIWNWTSSDLVTIQVYPVGMVFNGDNKYNLAGKYRESTYSYNLYDYINGDAWKATINYPNINYGRVNFWQCPHHTAISLKWDCNTSNGSGSGNYGYGLYKVEIQYRLNGLDEYPTSIDSCLIDWDYYPTGPGDLNIVARDIRPTDGQIEDPNRFTYQFYIAGNTQNLVPINYSTRGGYLIETWWPNGNGNYSNFNRQKVFGPLTDGGFFLYKTEGSYYPDYNSIFPLDPRRDCNVIPHHSNNPDYTDQNQVFPCNWDNYLNLNDDERIGELTLNLCLQKSVGTRINNWIPTLYQSYFTYLPPITIDPGASLKLDDGTISNPILLTLSDLYSTSYQDFFMTVKSSGNLILGNASQIIVQRKNHLVFECGSRIVGPNQSPFAEIHINGGNFCDQGSNSSGFMKIIFGNGTYTHCISCMHPFQAYYNDSSMVELDSGSVLQIPENTELSFNGSSSKLEMLPNSKIVFNSGSKLTLQNGAHIVATNASFSSTNAGSTWDGIYLSGDSHDTIIGCTIQNAVNGINITDKCSGGFTDNPSTEISSCTFLDSSSTQLTSGITVSNSNNVLIKNNTFISSPMLEGFLSAILLENCPSGNLDIIGNTIGSVTNGITSIQSSPYIAGNSINGQGNDGIGIYLDNSNGTLKYNNVHSFQKSYVSYYSSPYLYKNTFNGASDKNMDLYQNSVPVMNVVNSATYVMNIGGNNLISGQPSTCGIYINDNSYPAIDSGFNNFSLNGSNYMYCSDLQSQTLDVSYNYEWIHSRFLRFDLLYNKRRTRLG